MNNYFSFTVTFQRQACDTLTHLRYKEIIIDNPISYRSYFFSISTSEYGESVIHFSNHVVAINFHLSESGYTKSHFECHIVSSLQR